MKKLILGLAIAFLVGEGTAHADLAPTPVNRLMPRGSTQKTFVAVGLALALAVGLGGIYFARSKGWPRSRLGGFVGAALILAMTGVAVYLSAEDGNRNWERPRPRPGPEIASSEKEALVISLLAAAPDTGFPQCVPWTALVECTQSPSIHSGR